MKNIILNQLCICESERKNTTVGEMSEKRKKKNEKRKIRDKENPESFYFENIVSSSISLSEV